MVQREGAQQLETDPVKRVAVIVAGLLAGSLIHFGGSALAKGACSSGPEPGVDWSECRRSNLMLPESNLMGAKLERTDLSRNDMKKANLKGAHLLRAILYRTNLKGASLKKANMAKVQGVRAKFNGADFTGADMSKTELNRADFSSAILVKTDLTKSELARANFAGATVRDITLDHANISRALFNGVKFENVDFNGAYTYLARIEGADLSQTKNLTQRQLDMACGDDTTKIPASLSTPSNWPCEADD